MSYGEFTGLAPLDACAFWPIPATGDQHEINVKGLPPILVVSTTNDPATPYKAGVDLAQQLGGTLVHLRRHPAHRCLSGQQLHRRHRGALPCRRDRAAAEHAMLTIDHCRHSRPTRADADVAGLLRLLPSGADG